MYASAHNTHEPVHNTHTPITPVHNIGVYIHLFITHTLYASVRNKHLFVTHRPMHLFITHIHLLITHIHLLITHTRVYNTTTYSKHYFHLFVGWKRCAMDYGKDGHLLIIDRPRLFRHHPMHVLDASV